MLVTGDMSNMSKFFHEEVLKRGDTMRAEINTIQIPEDYLTYMYSY